MEKEGVKEEIGLREGEGVVNAGLLLGDREEHTVGERDGVGVRVGE